MPRPKGYPKTGGRQPGTKNKQPRVTLTLPPEKADLLRNVTNSELRRLAAKGIAPLEFFLGCMRDERLPMEDRKWGAAQAAPLLHPRLATVTTNANITGHLTLEALVAATLPGYKQIDGELAETKEESDE